MLLVRAMDDVRERRPDARPSTTFDDRGRARDDDPDRARGRDRQHDGDASRSPPTRPRARPSSARSTWRRSRRAPHPLDAHRRPVRRARARGPREGPAGRRRPRAGRLGVGERRHDPAGRDDPRAGPTAATHRHDRDLHLHRRRPRGRASQCSLDGASADVLRVAADLHARRSSRSRPATAGRRRTRSRSRRPSRTCSSRPARPIWEWTVDDATAPETTIDARAARRDQRRPARRCSPSPATRPASTLRVRARPGRRARVCSRLRRRRPRTRAEFTGLAARPAHAARPRGRPEPERRPDAGRASPGRSSGPALTTITADVAGATRRRPPQTSATFTFSANQTGVDLRVLARRRRAPSRAPRRCTVPDLRRSAATRSRSSRRTGSCLVEEPPATLRVDDRRARRRDRCPRRRSAPAPLDLSNATRPRRSRSPPT